MRIGIPQLLECAFDGDGLTQQEVRVALVGALALYQDNDPMIAGNKVSFVALHFRNRVDVSAHPF